MRPIKVALIDADILAYQSSIVSEQAYDWGDGLWTLHAFEEEAIHSFNSLLNSIIEKVEAEEFFLAFSDKDNWRKGVLPTYKSNRAGVRKPMLLKFIREYAYAQYRCISKPELEGDDVLGIWATSPDMTETADYVICSIDKDLKTIPGKHYNFQKNEFYTISEAEADYWHMSQALTGDTTDGYSGCPGVGPKGAEKVLQAAQAEMEPFVRPKQARAILWGHVVKAYAKAGLGEEEALVQARVSRILRASDYNDIQKQVILWSPNGSQ